jgi:hypothetical protein
MSRFERKGFVDFLSTKLTLFPIAAGWTLSMVFWVLDKDKRLVVFPGLAGAAIGLGAAINQWLFAPTIDPAVARRRQDVFDSLESAASARAPTLSRRGDLMTTAAAAEQLAPSPQCSGQGSQAL